MRDNRVNHTSNKVQETVKWAEIWEKLCSIYKCMEQLLFTVVVEQQSYNRIYVFWTSRIGSIGPRVVC